MLIICLVFIATIGFLVWCMFFMFTKGIYLVEHNGETYWLVYEGGFYFEGIKVFKGFRYLGKRSKYLGFNKNVYIRHYFTESIDIVLEKRKEFEKSKKDYYEGGKN